MTEIRRILKEIGWKPTASNGERAHAIKFGMKKGHATEDIRKALEKFATGNPKYAYEAKHDMHRLAEYEEEAIKAGIFA